MNKFFRIRIWVVLALAGLLVSCALPMSSTPTQFVFPTPNMTMTALFQIPPTATTAAVATQATGATATTQATAAGATLTPTAANCTNIAQLVSETIPDSSYIAPGSAFVKTWTLKNIGTCTWGAGYALAFDSGDPMGGPATVPLTVSVPPNALITLSVNQTAPTVAGQYKGNWKMQSPQAVKFGIGTGGANPFFVYITTVVVPVVPSCAAKTERPSANGELTEAYYANLAPAVVIDGLFPEWDLPLIDSVSNVVYKETDNTARFSLKWDATYLYLALKVADDNFVQETSGGANIYKGDSVEILIDTNLKGDYCTTDINSDDYQLGISPGYLQDTPLPSAYLWWPDAIKGSKVVDISARFTVAPDPAGWQMEARIPWNMFGNPSHIGGEYYGFALSVSDNDHTGTAQQDGMISTAPKRTTWGNPTLWGTLQIELKPGP